MPSSKNNFGFKHPTYPHLTLLFFLLGLFIFRSFLLIISLFPFVVRLAAAAAARVLVDAAEKPFDFFAHLSVLSIFNEAKVLPELLAKLQETNICSLTVFTLFLLRKKLQDHTRGLLLLWQFWVKPGLLFPQRFVTGLMLSHGLCNGNTKEFVHVITQHPFSGSTLLAGVACFDVEVESRLRPVPFLALHPCIE